MALSSARNSPLFGYDRSELFNHHSDKLEQLFGSGLFDRDVYPPMPYVRYAPRFRTWGVQSSSDSGVKNEKNRFQVMLNVSHFKPNEIKVKVVDNYIVVHGKHVEISDEHGFIQREFTRRYVLPEGAEDKTVKSSLTADGVLTIEAPKTVIEAPASNERVVPISLSFNDYENETSG